MSEQREEAKEAKEAKAITSRASVVASGTLVSRVLGLMREQVLAATFASTITDAFFVAFLIPNTLRQLLAEGAVQNGVLPVLTKVREEEGEQRAREFYRHLRAGFMLVLLSVVALGVVAAPLLVGLFAGGSRKYPGLFETTVTLTRWVFPYIFFMGLTALGVAALNTYRRFVVTAYAPALLNVAFIACALLLPTWLITRGYAPIHALTIGVLSGGLLQAVAQWPSLRAIGYDALPRLNFRDPAVREVARRMTPVLFGFGIYYVDVIVGRHLLSHEGVGAQSYFGFALRVCDFPQGIFVMAVQSATLPSLASFAARKDMAGLRTTFALGLRLALFVGIPATALLVVLSEPLVVLLFERGHFDGHSSIETGKSLFAQATGVWMIAAIRQLVIVFYALGDTRSPVIVSAIDFVVFVVAALLLRAPFGHVGISWAVSLASFVQLGLLWFALQRRLSQPLLSLKDSSSVVKMVLASVFAAVVTYATVTWLLPEVMAGTEQDVRVPSALVGTAVFGLCYLFASWLGRSAELELVVAPLRRRLLRA
jgi:putative peptidoglycan lipid II flippase